MAVDITPPNSFVRSPLTPPPTDKTSLSIVSRIINIFNKHSYGFRQGPWAEYSLSPNEFDELQCRVESNSSLSSEKIRYDYEPLNSRLTIRMPTPLHETFCAKVVREIISQLESIVRSRKPGADFAKNVEHFASSRIDLPPQDDNTIYTRREPDASFGHHKARFPGVIIEVCYSQKGRRIRSLADDYILDTDGSVNAVICLDIEYRGKEASLSIWRPRFEIVKGVKELSAACVIKHQLFRTSDGLPADSRPLIIKLKDFATEELTKGHPGLDSEIVISASDLCSFLEIAESRQIAQMRQEGSVNTTPAGTRKRRRAETPPEKIDSKDEAVFQTIEEEAERKRLRDSDYFPDSSDLSDKA